MINSDEMEKLIGPFPKESPECSALEMAQAMYSVGQALVQMHIVAEGDEGYAGSDYEADNLAAISKVKNYMNI